MLPVIQQYMNLLGRVCVSSFNEWSVAETTDIAQDNPELQKVIAKNKELISQHLQIDTSLFTRDYLVEGNEWPDVAELNKFLLSKTRYNKSDVIDINKFDRITYTMVRKFQTDTWLKVDGIAWEKTYAEIKKQSKNNKVIDAVSITQQEIPTEPVVVDKVVEKLDEYVWEKDQTVAEAKKQEKQLKHEIMDTSLFTRTLRKGSEWADVAELNKFLVAETNMYILSSLEVDTFNQDTIVMLKKFQESNGLIADGIAGDKTYATIIKQLQFVEKTDDTIVVWKSLGEQEKLRHEDASKVSEQIDTAQKSMQRTSDMLTVTPMINSVLSERGFHENRGFSIERGFRELLDTDSYESILGRKDEFKWKIEWIDTDKLKSAITFLTRQPEEVSVWQWDTEENIDFTEVLDFVIKVTPWLYGVYLWDLPLPFIKNGMKGADIDKAKSFYDWIQDGGKEDFEQYYKNNKGNYKVDLIEQQYTLQNILATLQITDATSATEIQDKMNHLSTAEEKLLTKYIEVRLIPDLKIMRTESFNFFERILFDSKASKTQKIIAQMEDTSTNGATDLELAQQVLELLKKEDDDDVRNYINTVENRNDYMSQVEENQDILDTMAKIIGTENSNLNILFLTGNVDQFFDAFGVPINLQRDVRHISYAPDYEYAQLLSKKPILKEFFATVGTEKYQEFRLKNMDAELKYLRLQRRVSTQHTQAFDKSGAPINSQKYGGHIDGMNGPEALEQILTTYPENPYETTFDLLYKGIIEKSERNGFSASDLYSTIEWGSMVPISELEWALVNTGRETNMDNKVTSFSGLTSERGDTEIFKWKPITKEYSYVTENGEKVVETVEYNTYLRPDCSNLLIVPESIMVTVNGVENPQFPMGTMTSHDGYIPIAVAWDTINGSNSGSGGWSDASSWNNPSSTPWAWWNTNTPGTPSGAASGNWRIQ